MWRKRRRGDLAPRRGLRLRAAMEPLEYRFCPSTYNYQIIAQTGVNVTGLGNGPSINDSGQVAFVEQFADGSNSIFVGDGSSAPVNVSASLQNPVRTFQNAVQINDSGQIAAVDRVSGSPPSYYLRIWNSSNDNYQVYDQAGPGTNYDSFFNSDSIDNQGDVTYIAKLAGAGTVALISNQNSISTLPSPQPFLNPMAADGGLVVARADHDPSNPSQNPIDLFQPDGPVTVIASTPDFIALGASPGISADGQVVAFYGDLTPAGADALNYAQAQAGVPSLNPGPGIFASINTTSHGRVLLRIAGQDSQPFLNPGETFKNLNNTGNPTGNPKDIGVKQFDQPDAPVAVNSTQATGGAVTIVYMAQGDDGSDGIYANRLDFLPNASGILDPNSTAQET